MLRRIFKGKRPTAEVLYATLRKMTAEQSEDAYKMLNIYTGAEQDDEMKEDVGGHKAAVQEDKSIDEEDVGVDAAANEKDVGGKPASDKVVVQEDVGDDVGDKAAGNRAAGDRAAAEENAVEKAAVEEEAVEEAAVEKDAIEEDAVQEDEAVEKQDVEEHEAVVEALLAVGSTAIEGDVMVETSISKMWADEMKLLDTQRDIARFEKEEQERSQPIERHQLLYPQPWWQLDSVLVLCHVHGHWMLCHVLLKEGKVMVYDSLNERRSGLSPQMKEIRGLLYLLPSTLKHAGYYQQIKMDPRSTPFTAESMHSDLIPQQDDGNSCGAFLLKYAELIMAGVPTPWKSIFG
ncbi:hypothetical protein LWI29_006149 [Acer saccharum]|uniref:Ubiquitin-like protease family profile domain-containing protein n=1 Tax=Acer saccharum TaxID=4024 RepID=A0AA39VB91_ACESA|nr:hypothetical protein LWI29_006149 [Acer saccharum]